MPRWARPRSVRCDNPELGVPDADAGLPAVGTAPSLRHRSGNDVLYVSSALLSCDVGDGAPSETIPPEAGNAHRETQPVSWQRNLESGLRLPPKASAEYCVVKKGTALAVRAIRILPQIVAHDCCQIRMTATQYARLQGHTARLSHTDHRGRLERVDIARCIHPQIVIA